MQRATEGRPAYSDRRASAWQYWQSILYVCTCTLWGKVMGCTEGRAAAGCRLHEDTARKTRMARSAKPSAPTPAFALIDGRGPSGAFEEACETYHQRRKQVNIRPLGESAERLGGGARGAFDVRSEEHTSELQSLAYL